MFLFAAAALSYDDKCVAQLKTADPIQNGTLKFVQVLTRHGARAPLQNFGVPQSFRGYWLCDADDASAPRMHAAPVTHYRRFKQVLDPRLTEYLPNCRSGDLMVTGMKQHENLGELYHKYLYETTKLFTELPPDPQNIYARCSDVERTFRSAESFLHGAFPPQSPDELITIYTDTDSGSSLRTNEKWCKDLHYLWGNHTESEEYTKWVDENWEKVAKVGEFLHLQKSGDNLNAVCDYVATHYCGNKQAPSVVTKEIEQVCLTVTSNYLYDFYTKDPQLPASYTMRELMKIPRAIKEGKSKVKFALMSAHDTTVAAVRTFLMGDAAREERIPPFATHLTTELYDINGVLNIRFVYNGVPMPLALLENQELVTFDDFIGAYGNAMDTKCTDFK